MKDNYDDIPSRILREVLKIAEVLKLSPYSDETGETVIKLREELAKRKSDITKPSMARINRSGRNPTTNVNREGFSLITSTDLGTLIQNRIALTYLDDQDNPKRRTGFLIRVTPSKVRVEAFSGRHWDIAINRLMRVESLSITGRTIRELWYDRHGSW